MYYAESLTGKVKTKQNTLLRALYEAENMGHNFIMKTKKNKGIYILHLNEERLHASAHTGYSGLTKEEIRVCHNFCSKTGREW